mmetsp:Transcript_16292/g.57857  ORF Transcript_16292/g.57857 Transcript_16292/m.57857 type:complete len:534 (-) Transcript_16292:63-1664(-)
MATNGVAAAQPPADLGPVFAYLEAHEEVYVQRLKEAVAIRSVSAWVDHRPQILVMLEWAQAWAVKLGASEARLVDNPLLATDATLPPMLLVTFDAECADAHLARTVCAYGHLDVQPARLEDGWDSEPFDLTELDGKLYGRGASDDKGPALSWLWAVEAHRELKLSLPVKLQLLFEGMEEYGSEGLPEFVKREAVKGGWLTDADHFVISDNQWLSRTTPCLTYGLRGVAYFVVQVEGGATDLHSGVYGGSVHEPLNDLVHLLATLREPVGKGGKMHHERIRVEGILNGIAPVTDEERKLYSTLDFDVKSYEVGDVKGHSLESPDAESVLMARWRWPTLSIHGVEGAFSDTGAKTVIPGCVKGKFSIRLVPGMEPDAVTKLVKAHLEKEWRDTIGSPLKLSVECLHGGPAWLSRTDHPNYVAAAKAVERVYGRPPDFTREGGSIPVANWLSDATQMNVVLLSTSACDDGAHAQNEKYNRANLVNGIKTLAAYLHEISALVGPRPSLCRCDPPTEAELNMPGAFAFAKGFKCRCEI